MRVLGVGALILFVAVSALGQTQRLRVFVGPQVRDGFVDIDQGVVESIQQITDEFKRSRIFEVVRTRKDAVIVLDVVGVE